ncbi:MAG: hypothetical protein D6732_18520 [Methanobacteriota archaeon]|nr:MAG: hypothetical protein D6732_18520 [Euryarchaeota archaeon]
MEETNASVVAAILAYSIAAVFNGILVVLKEEISGIFNFMKSIPPFYHHWITQMYFLLIVFAIIYFVFKSRDDGITQSVKNNPTGWIIWSSVIGAAIIAIYMFYHGIILH